MSWAKRRRKVSAALALIASVPLVAGVSIQELGTRPPAGAAESCQNVLSTDLPACTVQDFTGICSNECQISTAGIANALKDTCTSTVASDQTGPLFGASGELLLCSAQPPTATLNDAIPGDAPAGTSETDPNAPSAAFRAHIEEPFVEPFPASPSQNPPASVLSAVVSNFIPHISESASNAAPSNARSIVISTGPNSPFIPPFVIPGPSSPPPAVPIASKSNVPPPGLSSIIANILLPATPTTTSAPTISIIAGPPLVGGQPPGVPLNSAPTTLQASAGKPETGAGAPTMSFVLQPKPSDPVPMPPSPSANPAAQSRSSSARASTSAAPTTADTANLGTNAMPTADQMRQVNPGIIGGVVGGGLGAIAAIVALIIILSRRRRKAREQRESSRRDISSWDFIDSQRNMSSSLGSGSVGQPERSFIDKPIFVDQRVQQVAVPQQVTIRRVSGPPVVVRRSLGPLDQAQGLDERTMEALGMTMKSGKTKYTASQYSRNSSGASSIIVGYEAPEPVPKTPATMLGGSPGPTVYRGSTTTVGGGGSRKYGENPRYPSPIDEEVPEVPTPQVPMPRRSTFYDPFMGERMFKGQQAYGRI